MFHHAACKQHSCQWFHMTAAACKQHSCQWFHMTAAACKKHSCQWFYMTAAACNQHSCQWFHMTATVCNQHSCQWFHMTAAAFGRRRTKHTEVECKHEYSHGQKPDIDSNTEECEQEVILRATEEIRCITWWYLDTFDIYPLDQILQSVWDVMGWQVVGDITSYIFCGPVWLDE